MKSAYLKSKNKKTEELSQFAHQASNNIPALTSAEDDINSIASGFTGQFNIIAGYGRQSSIVSQPRLNKLGGSTPGASRLRGGINSRGAEKVSKEEVESFVYKEQFVGHMKDILTKPKRKSGQGEQK
jgi:hypothetical protein